MKLSRFLRGGVACEPLGGPEWKEDTTTHVKSIVFFLAHPTALFDSGVRSRRRASPPRRRRWLEPAFAVALATLVSYGPAPAAPPELELLDDGAAVTAALTPGESHSYRLRLAPGESALVMVEQLGVDVVVEAREQDQAPLTAVDAPLDRSGTELLLVEGGAGGGELRVEIWGREVGAPAGRYRLRLRRLDPGDPALGAARAATGAGELYFVGSAVAWREALGQERLAASLWQRLDEEKLAAQALYSAAVLARLLGDAGTGLDLAQRVLPRWQRLGETTFEASTANEAGLDHWLLGDLAAARDLFTRAAALHRSASHGYGEAAARANLCLLDLVEGQLQDGAACYEKVLPLLEAAGATDLESAARASAGHAYRLLGEPRKALAQLQRGVELARSGGDPTAEARALNNLADLLLASGEPEEALLRFGQALDLFRRLDDTRWQARTLNNLGLVYDTLGEPERALDTLEQALALRRKAGDTPGEAHTLSDLGRLQARAGHPRQALDLHRRALELWRRTEDRRGQALALSRQAEALETLGRALEARPLLEEALTLFRATDDRADEALALARLGRIRGDLGEVAVARENLEAALALFRTGGDPAGQARTLDDLARLEHRQGRTETAAKHAAEALELVETLRTRVLNPDLRAAYSSGLQDAYDLRIELLMEAHRAHPEAGFDRQALDVTERARARTLLELLAESRVEIHRGVAEALLAERRELLQRLGAKAERLWAEPVASPRRRVLEAESEEILRDLDRVEARIRQQSPALAALTRPRPLTSDAVRDLLDEGTVALSFYLGTERSYGWWITSDGIATFDLPPRARIEAAVERVHRDLARFDPEERSAEQRRAAELSEMLLGPVAERLAGQRLVVIPDGALAYLPFSALPLPAGAPGVTAGRELVVDHHEVLSVPSASALAVLRRSRAAHSPAAGLLAVVADPVFGIGDPRVRQTTSATADTPGGLAREGSSQRFKPSLERLPATRQEAQDLLALAAPAPTFAALDFDASRDTVLAGRLDGFGVVHFATHGVLDTERPALSGLMLSRVGPRGEPRDGFLGLHDVYNLRLSADLVVLSGCQTALGRRLRGEGLVGLVRGFFHAGTPRVLASLWKVDDRATEELMGRFYRHLWRDGASPAAALRAAQSELRRGRRFRDSAHWAGFVLAGDWR